jgi:hypothetical protein
MQVSHGALLAIAETSLALWEVGTVKEQYDTQADALSSIIESLPPKSLVTFGSEHIREAACHLITCLSKTELKQVGKLEGWKKVVFGSLERKEENVQEYAVLAFGAVAKTYGISKEEVYHCLVQIEISNQMVYGRRGYALALGEIDYKLYPEWLHDVLVQICKATQAQPQVTNGFILSFSNE